MSISTKTHSTPSGDKKQKAVHRNSLDSSSIQYSWSNNSTITTQSSISIRRSVKSPLSDDSSNSDKTILRSETFIEDKQKKIEFLTKNEREGNTKTQIIGGLEVLYDMFNGFGDDTVNSLNKVSGEDKLNKITDKISEYHKFPVKFIEFIKK